MDIQVTPVAGDKWLIRAERERNGHTASGQVVMIQNTAPTAANAPHAALAGARAWLALAQDRQAASDVDGAIANAQAGLAELGRGYYSSSLGMKDDTRQHIDRAEDLIENDRKPEALRTLIQALESRLAMYARLHAATIYSET